MIRIESMDKTNYSNSRTRYYQLIIFIVMFVSYAFYTLNRKTFSLVLPELMRTVLNKNDAGYIISSQNIAYAISKFIGSILSDHLSSRFLLAYGLFFSGLATTLFPYFTGSVWTLSFCWFCNGFAQGFGWPSCARLLRLWFSPEQLGTLWSILSGSANLSGGLSPLVATMITLNFGWKTTFFTFGLFSVLMSFIAFTFIVNSPENVELHIINSNDTPFNDKKNDSMELLDSKWIDLFKNPLIWLISFSYMVVYAVRTTANDWGQLFLLEEKNKSQLVASSFISSLEYGGFFGGVLAGYITDIIIKQSLSNNDLESKRLLSKLQTNSNDRLPVATVMMLVASLTLHWLCFYIDSSTSYLVINMMGFMLGVTLYGPITVFGVMGSESAPNHLSGTSQAIVNLAANIGAIISGFPLCMIAKNYSWMAVFFLLECIISFNVLILLVFGHRSLKIYQNDISKKKKQN